MSGTNEYERNIEKDFISKLEDLNYIYRSDIKDLAGLEANFKKKFEALNRVNLSDNEFQRLLNEIVSSDVFEASQRLRNIESFDREDGTPLNYTLINTKDWCKNTYEVINQLKINTHSSYHIYDVMILINGIPVVQIELKKHGISPRKAMKQIVDYKEDAGNGYTKTLLCFVQLFIASNSSDTFYYTNNNSKHFLFDAKEQFLPIYRFADQNNKKITNLYEFTDQFLPKCTLGEMISKYIVLVKNEQKLLMMRPYQIYAVKYIIDCINQNCGNGFIWHTTGSGKTLTSFKASTLLKLNENIHKCIFVVDRKDLDSQTRDEFNKFQENCVEENTNTDILVKRMLSNDYANKVIVTTIQKLGLALNQDSQTTQKDNSEGHDTYRQQLQPLKDKRIVFIFDECHRSQFGENHKAIKEFFPKCQLFGFTGTPIFEDNATIKKIKEGTAQLQTTEDLFQRQLHKYTITDAIDDKYVLPFHIDYYEPKETKITVADSRTKQAIVEAIIEKHDTATSKRRFNALFATGSINDAIEYYEIFRTLQSKRLDADPNFRPLKVTAIFTPPGDGNQDIKQIQEDLAQEKEDNKHNPAEKKQALSTIISNYNERYSSSESINNFDSYYKDVQGRIKDHKIPNGDLTEKGAEKIDITIVVDMLLTGFDSKYLNTLYVDKNLKHHTLIQAFSRTNRILNSTKPHGIIIDFRQQQERVDEAITLFSGTNLERSRQIWLVEKPDVVISQFKSACSDLNEFMHSKGLETKPDQVFNLKGQLARVQFIKLFQKIQSFKNQLDQYTNLTEAHQTEIQETLPKNDYLDFRCNYLGIAQQLDIPDEYDQETETAEVDQIDYEFVLFSSAYIDYDYIMKLISEYSNQDPLKQEITQDELIALIRSDSKFLDEHDDFTEFVKSLKVGEGLDEVQIRSDFKKFKEQKQDIQIKEIAQTHRLSHKSLASFVDDTVSRRSFDGDQLTDLMASLGLSWYERYQQECALMAELVPLLKKRANGEDITGLRAYDHMKIDEPQ